MRNAYGQRTGRRARDRHARNGTGTLLCLLGFLVLIAGCNGVAASDEEEQEAPSLFNLAHLEHLTEVVEHDGTSMAIVHIYADAPDYAWVADDDEGAACVDDAARAAVLHLRHFELTGDATSRERAEQLLRFIMYMQRADGLFYNFVWNSELDINEEHPNSRADEFGWWASRAVWALGTGARVLKDVNPEFAEAAAERVRRTYPHLKDLLARYGRYEQMAGRAYPQWLVYETASDATSELLLGLVALQQAYPDPELQGMIQQFAEGVAAMQFGAMSTFPYGAHASFVNVWHGWGNSQTQALAEAGIVESARREAEHFYPRLLVEGWLHSFPLDDPAGARTFEQIAYAVRCVAVGLVRLYETTGDARYARMAGLAASWFTGNNVAGVAMYDPATGRGYDGIDSSSHVNYNAGAESTIEALATVLEVEQHPEAAAWMHARGGETERVTKQGATYLYRVFSTEGDGEEQRLAVVMNVTDERLELLEGEALDDFLASDG